jgi:hypothetical protein
MLVNVSANVNNRSNRKWLIGLAYCWQMIMNGNKPKNEENRNTAYQNAKGNNNRINYLYEVLVLKAPK